MNNYQSINPSISLLDFEKPLQPLYNKVEALLKKRKTNKTESQLSELEKKIIQISRDIYKKLSHWDRTQVARHPNRPYSLDYIDKIFTKHTILSGDRNFADDKSILCGLSNFNDETVVFVGQQKGRNTEENMLRNFGMPKPEGYRKAMRFFEMAQKFQFPIFTFIDTPGAYPGLESEERSQGEAIARNLKVMAGLTVPVISVVVGEGGSGGALGIGLANRVMMMENSIYSVISPESCASILWKDANQKEKAASVLKNDAKTALKYKIIDEIIAEGPQGAHRNWDIAIKNLHEGFKKHLSELKKMSPIKLKQQRIEKFTAMGEIALTKSKKK